MHNYLARRMIRQALLMPDTQSGRLPRILTEELAAIVTDGTTRGPGEQFGTR